MKKHKGFTFVELLIALAIFSIIAVSIYHTLHNGVRLWSEVGAVIRHNQRSRIFFDAISSDLRNAASYSGLKSEWGDRKISFPVLVTVSGNGGPHGEIVKATYYFDDGKGELRSSYADKDIGFDEKKADERVCLDDLESIEFEYPYEASADEDKYVWKDKWESEEKMPRGVKIKIKFNKKGESIQEAFEKAVFIPLGELGEEE